MKPLFLLVTLAVFALDPGEVLAECSQAAYPTVAMDQSRPPASAAVRPGTATSNIFNDDPCTIDPSWCGGDPELGSRGCGSLCSTKSCGTKASDQVCRADRSTGVVFYSCVEAAGRFCDSYTDPGNRYICATCLQ
ncbi:MAG: hypothetical protein QOJ98_3476 [Acidobacteriota bacterium]|jgi:hypothetical protein|nr:hypothetical protein [Acidobacteriota bacterium]